MKVSEMRVGQVVDSPIELRVMRLEDGKAPVGKTPYQHVWLGDQTGQIRFTLFGKDIGTLSGGEVVEITNGYVREYPKDSGKLSLALSKEGGCWKVLEKPVGTVSGRPTLETEGKWELDERIRENLIIRQSSLRSACTLLSGKGDAVKAIEIARQFTEWVMGDTVPGWILDDKTRKRFWAKTNDKALKHEEVHKALEVASLKDFRGTEEEAYNMIEAWLKGNSAE